MDTKKILFTTVAGFMLALTVVSGCVQRKRISKKLYDIRDWYRRHYEPEVEEY